MKNFEEIEKLLEKRPEEMAKTCGCSLSTYYRYRKGKANPDVKVLKNFLEAHPEMNTEWLLRDKGPALKKDLDFDDNKQSFVVHDKKGNSIEFTSIPYFKLNSESQDGEGTLLYDEWKQSKDEYIICNNFIEIHVDVAKDSVTALKVNTQSMEPTLPEGSLCVVDTGVNRFMGESVYLVRVKEFLKLKVLQFLPNGKLRSTSQNSLFPPVEIDPSDNGFSIEGRVVWVGRKL